MRRFAWALLRVSQRIGGCEPTDHTEGLGARDVLRELGGQLPFELEDLGSQATRWTCTSAHTLRFIPQPVGHRVRRVPEKVRDPT